MSLNFQPLHLVPTVDQRIDVQKLQKLLYGVESCGTTNTYQEFPITNASASNLSINACNPPDKNTFTSRRAYLKVVFRLTFTGKSGALNACLIQAKGMKGSQSFGGVNNSYYDAPRAYALSNSLNTVQITTNGQPVVTNLNQYNRALSRYYNDVKCQDIYRSYEPSMLDQFLTYDALDNSGLYFQARNPLGEYGDTLVETPRGSYWGAVITRNDHTNTQGDIAIVDLTLYAPIMMSPWGFSCHDDLPSFLGLSNVSFLATLGGRGSGQFGGLLQSLWSHNPASPATFSSAVVSVISSAVYFQYFTPPLDLQIPESLTYQYTEPLYISNNTFASQGAGVQATLQFQATTLDSVPSLMYVWVAKQDTDVDWTDTDTYFSIEQINVSFMNVVGILSTASSIDLYNISTRNGCNMNYTQFSNKCGSVLALRFGEDITMPTLTAAGSAGSYNFSMKITCTNNYSVSVIPQISCLFVHTGTFTIEKGRVVKSIGVLTQQDVLNTKNSPEAKMPRNPQHADNALGGISWGDITSWFKKAGRSVIDFGKKVIPIVAPEFTPVIQGADILAQRLGFGNMKGGKKMSNAQMLKLMHQK